MRRVQGRPAAAPTAMSFHWPPLESNPEIFSDYMHTVGLPAQWAFGEVFGFDEDLLAFLPQPVIAVVANVERLKKQEEKARGDPALPVQFYMKQTGNLDNACGVIACVYAVYNNLAAMGGLPEQSVLGKHLAATSAMTPEERAAALDSNTDFQAVHVSKAAEGDSAQPSEQSDVRHHFVAFVLVDGKLVELDGTKAGPLLVAESCDDVLRGTIEVIKQRLEAGEYSDRLSLMTLNANPDGM